MNIELGRESRVIWESQLPPSHRETAPLAPFLSLPADPCLYLISISQTVWNTFIETDFEGMNHICPNI